MYGRTCTCSSGKPPLAPIKAGTVTEHRQYGTETDYLMVSVTRSPPGTTDLSPFKIITKVLYTCTLCTRQWATGVCEIWLGLQSVYMYTCTCARRVLSRRSVFHTQGVSPCMGKHRPFCQTLGVQIIMVNRLQRKANLWVFVVSNCGENIRCVCVWVRACCVLMCMCRRVPYQIWGIYDLHVHVYTVMSIGLWNYHHFGRAVWTLQGS